MVCRHTLSADARRLACCSTLPCPPQPQEAASRRAPRLSLAVVSSRTPPGSLRRGFRKSIRDVSESVCRSRTPNVLWSGETRKEEQCSAGRISRGRPRPGPPPLCRRPPRREVARRTRRMAVRFPLGGSHEVLVSAPGEGDVVVRLLIVFTISSPRRLTRGLDVFEVRVGCARSPRGGARGRRGPTVDRRGARRGRRRARSGGPSGTCRGSRRPPCQQHLVRHAFTLQGAEGREEVSAGANAAKATCVATRTTGATGGTDADARAPFARLRTTRRSSATALSAAEVATLTRGS